MIKNIVVVGLGKIGSGIFATLGHRDFNVLGVDINKDIVNKINTGKAPFQESGLEDLIKQHNLKATIDLYKAVSHSECTFIMMPTPSKEDGSFDSEYLETAIAEVGRSIPNDIPYYLVVITSTTTPGDMTNKIAPLLEQTSGRKLGRRLGLVYMPEMAVALGNVVHGLLHPDAIIIGESDKRAGRVAELIVKQWIDCYAITPIHHMSFHNAELTKIASNAYICMKMSFANTVAQICENMPTGDARIILDAVGSDSRIGKKYLKPGLSYGGTCFVRDDIAFPYIAKKYKTRGDLVESARQVNLSQTDFIVSKILHVLSKEGTNKISILGITYKPDIYYEAGIIESPVIKIMEKLSENGVEMTVYDPVFKQSGGLIPIKNVVAVDKIKEATDNAKIVFIATPWDEFKYLNLKNPVIIDAFGIQNKLRNNKDIKYIEIGNYMLD